MNVAIYARVSTAEQVKNGYSLSEQVRLLEDYCKLQKWPVFDTYVDAGISGAKFDRPAFQQMLEDIKDGSIDRVLVWKLDRLGRSTKDILIALEDYIIPSGADLVSLTESLDTQTSFGKATISILSTMAQIERDQIKERLAVGREARAREGKYHGGKRPIGYQYKDGALVVDPYEAMIIRKMFEMYADGLSCYGIAKKLNEDGLILSGKYWEASHIANLVKSELYVGRIRHRGEWFDGIHEPIITEELFRRVQSRQNDAGERIPSASSKCVKSLLGGLLYCGVCGAKMTHNRQVMHERGKERIYETYICTNKKNYSKNVLTNYKPCPNRRWTASKLENAVLGEVWKLRLDPDHVARPKKAADDGPVIRAEIEKLNNQISKLMDLYLVDGMPVDVLQTKTEALNEQKARLTEKLRKKKSRKPLKRSEAAALSQSLADIIDSANMEDSRKILLALIEKIVVTGNDVAIYWKF